MKIKYIIFTFVCIALFYAIKFMLDSNSIKSENSTTKSISINSIITNHDFFVVSSKEQNYNLTLDERQKMNPKERIDYLEKLGQVPAPNDNWDWYYASKTSWWGKRLDPNAFWKGRVVWYDDEAEWSARSRGRGYPPMPYNDPSISDRSDVDNVLDDNWFHIEDWQPDLIFSDRESVFWNEFIISHPNPPKEIQSWLGNIADTWLNNKYRLENDPVYAKKLYITQKNLEEFFEYNIREAKKICSPHESINPESFKWDHVMRKRTEYEELVASGKYNDEKVKKWFFDHVYVEHELITEPLTEEQVDAANAWKVAYLNRLRYEKWDKSYINAYLEAWNLTDEYVFGNKKENNEK